MMAVKKKTKKPVVKPAKKSIHLKAPYPHFRYYRKNNHPALIVGEQSVDEYCYRKVMHREKDGRHSNEMIYPNPNKKDPNAMYIAKRVRHDKISNFEDKPLSWKYPKK
ncbi:MAG: hypothetical protein IJV77_05070 [Clostridia bacterium]|nr:hypothetical protein [Clostridia bacterium]